MAGESQLRQRVVRKGAYVEHLGPRADRLAVEKTPRVGDSHHAGRGRFGDVVYAEQPGDLNRGADLLATLTHGGGDRVLVLVDEAARKAPQPVAGLDRAPAQDDAAGCFDHDR